MILHSLFFGRQLDAAGFGWFTFPAVHSGLMSDMHMTIQWQVPALNAQQK